MKKILIPAALFLSAAVLIHAAPAPRPPRNKPTLDGARIKRDHKPHDGKCLKCKKAAAVFRFGVCPLCDPSIVVKPVVVDPRASGTAR